MKKTKRGLDKNLSLWRKEVKKEVTKNFFEKIWKK